MTDLKDKTVEEVFAEVIEFFKQDLSSSHAWEFNASVRPLIARRLEKAQKQIVAQQTERKAEVDGIMLLRAELGARDDETFPDFVRRLAKQNAAHDAEVAAKALEAFLARYHSTESAGSMKGSRATAFANEMISEYRNGRKE